MKGTPPSNALKGFNLDDGCVQTISKKNTVVKYFYLLIQ